MNDQLDALLHDDFLRPPSGFTQRVMRRIELLAPLQSGSMSATPVPPQTRRWNRLRWLLATAGLVASGLLGLSQLASFVFGWWLVAAAI